MEDRKSVQRMLLKELLLYSLESNWTENILLMEKRFTQLVPDKEDDTTHIVAHMETLAKSLFESNLHRMANIEYLTNLLNGTKEDHYYKTKDKLVSAIRRAIKLNSLDQKQKEYAKYVIQLFAETEDFYY